MAARVIRREGRVWIDGIPSFSDLGSPVSTFAGSLAAATAVTDHPLDVEDVLALSGYAFHTRWCHSGGEPTGCPGSVSLEQGYLPAALSVHSGWRIETLYGPCGWGEPDMQRAIQDVLASIDAGVPVVIEDRYINASLLYGYTDGGKVLARTYIDGHVEADWSHLGQDPALAFVLGDYVDPPPFPHVFCDVLANAVTWWHQEHEPGTCGGPGMRIGRTALSSWARFYASVEALAATYPRGKGGLLYNSLMNFQHLYENRIAAARFLSRHAGSFPQAEEAIRKAAAIYCQETEVLAGALDREDAGWREMNAVRCRLVERTPASAPWDAARSVTTPDVWTAALQARERCIMEQALALEATAIACLEEARGQIEP